MRYHNALLGLILIAASLLCGSANATSFDCKKASTYAEIQICNSPKLQLQDEQLNSAYVQALDKTSDKANVRSEQLTWIKQRDMCLTVDCVSQAMKLRTLSLLDNGAPRPASQPKSITAPVTPAEKINSHALMSRMTAATDSAQSQAKARPQADSGQAVSPVRDALTTRTLKIGSFVMVVLLLICIWLHSRGSMVIYSCYTDALWTTMTPFLSIGSYFIAKSWLELSTDISLISAAVVAGLMFLQIIIQTFRSNGFSFFFLLALYAKMVLFSIYFLSMAALILGGGPTASDRRRRRNWALAGSVLFAALTSWMCRNRQFSHIDDYIAGRT